MNYADARLVATALEKQGYRATHNSDEADLVVLQTCTVRQQSEDKAYNKLRALYANKLHNPNFTLAVMGCVVGVRGNETGHDRTGTGAGDHLGQQFLFHQLFDHTDMEQAIGCAATEQQGRAAETAGCPVEKSSLA